MKRVRVELICDEGFVADSLCDLAALYEDSLEYGEFELSYGTAIIEEYKEEE